MELRDYQRECLIKSRNAIRRGLKRGLVSLPTGTGKTAIFSHYPKLFEGKMLVLAHREELLDQAAEMVQTINPDLNVQVEQAGRRADKDADIVIGSVQTLMAPARLSRWEPDEFSTIIIDEAHHSVAASYLKILCHFGLVPDVSGAATKAEAKSMYEDFAPSESAPSLLGFTATPSRTDKRGLEWIYDELVFSRTILEMMEAGWVCSIRGQRIGTDTDISEVKVRAGEFAVGDLSEAVNTAERNGLVVSSYLTLAAGRQAIAFAVDVKHANDLYESFLSAGVKAGVVVGETAADERHTVINEYRDGVINVIVNCMVLTEGFDAPITSCLLMARPTKSQLLYTQMLGRGTRTAPGKDDLLVIDLVDVGKLGVPSLNTMFGLPPKLKVDDDDVLTTRKVMDELEAQIPMSALDNAVSIQDVRDLAQQFDPLNAARPEDFIQATLAWVKTSFGYALSMGDGGHLGVIVGHLGASEVRMRGRDGYTESLGWHKYPQVAIAMAEQWVRANRSEQLKLLENTASWRGGAPSEKQLNLLKSLGVRVPVGATKGDVSTLIDAHMAGRSDSRSQPPTAKQLWYCRTNRITVPEGATKGTITKLISDYRNNLQEVS